MGLPHDNDAEKRSALLHSLAANTTLAVIHVKLVGNGIYLRFLQESDAVSVVALNQRNRDFFEPYLIDRPEEFYSVEYQQMSIHSGLAMMEQDQKYSFGIFLSESHELVGVVSLTEIVRVSLSVVLARILSGPGTQRSWIHHRGSEARREVRLSGSGSSSHRSWRDATQCRLHSCS